MQKARLDDSQAGIKIDREIYTDGYYSNGRKRRGTKPLDETEREE